MLSLFARRVALSTHCSTATYTRILPLSAPSLRYRRPLDNRFHTGTVHLVASPRRGVSTEAVAATGGAKPSTKSTTTGRKKRGKELTPEQKAAQAVLLQAKRELERGKKKEQIAALKAKLKAQAVKKREAAAMKRKRLAEKEREAAALQRKRLVEKKKKLAQQEKERRAKKPKIIKPPPKSINGFALLIHELKKGPSEAVVVWRNLSEEGKREYAARAKEVTQRRKEEFDAFVKTVTRSDIFRYNSQQRSKGRTKSVIRVKSKKTRPLMCFMKYMQEFRTRPDQAGKRPVEVSKAAGKAWHSLTQEERDSYNAVPSESPTA